MVIYLLIDKLEKSIADEGEHDYFKYITWLDILNILLMCFTSYMNKKSIFVDIVKKECKGQVINERSRFFFIKWFKN
jgi:hypothetical protein